MKLFISQIDKANHFIVGTIVCSLAILFVPALYAFLITLIIGAAKEGYDLISDKGTPDIKDLLFTLAGAIPVLISHI